MALTTRQEQQLAKIVELVEAFKREAEKAPPEKRRGTSGRSRRTGAEAAKMRDAILAARARGVSAAKLAEKYGVSTAYIYMIKE